MLLHSQHCPQLAPLIMAKEAAFTMKLITAGVVFACTIAVAVAVVGLTG